MFKSLSHNIRFAAGAAMAAGCAWAVTGAIHLTAGDEVQSATVETTLAHVMLGMLSVALLLTVPAVLALARRARTPVPGYVAAVGQVALAIAATTSNVAGEDPTFFLVVAPIANARWFFGTIGLAVSLYRAGEVSKQVAFALPAIQLFCLPLSAVGGGIIGGAIWIAVGYLMSVGALPRREAAAAVA
jgi:hypothetical protein